MSHLDSISITCMLGTILVKTCGWQGLAGCAVAIFALKAFS